MSDSRKRAVAYPRVSGSVQEDGTSLETQAAAMVKMASGLGYTIAPEDVLPEVGTGINLDRLVLDKIRGMASAEEIGAVFAYSTDRLSRDPVDLLVLIREFNSHGVEVYFVQDPVGQLAGGRVGKVRARVLGGQGARADSRTHHAWSAGCCTRWPDACRCSRRDLRLRLRPG